MIAVKLALGTAMLATGGLVASEASREAAETARWYSELPATAMLGIALMAALLVIFRLLSMIFGKLLSALEENTKASQRVANAIEFCRDRNHGPHEE